jgi:hypothetical protein
MEHRVFAWAEQRCHRRIDALVKDANGIALMRLARLTGPHVAAGTVADVPTRAASYDQSWVLILYETGARPDATRLPAMPVPDWSPPAQNQAEAEDWLRAEARRRICADHWISEGHVDASALEIWLKSP